MDNHQTISNLIISYSGQQRTINIPVLYLELLEDYNVAVMLNQLIYWSDRSNRTDGYFYKNYKEWQEEVFLSQYQVKKAVDKLKKLELVETKLKKSYGSPTLHYKVNMDNLSIWIMKKLNNGKSNNLINDYQKTNDSLTKNTSKNTTTRESDQKNKIDCIQKYQQDIGIINPNQLQQITDWITDFDKNKQGEEIISEAINQSVKEKAKSFAYLNNKLKRYADANVQTLDDAKAQDKEYNKKTYKKDLDVSNVLEGL